MKPDKMLVKVAQKLGIDLHHDEKRKKGETLLEWRMRSWVIPPVTTAPIDNQVIVWRLPPLQLSAGGLLIPEDSQSPNVKGVILGMGPRAMDILVSNGIEAGHIVLFSRFAGWELTDHLPEHQRHSQILVLKSTDILGSDDLREQLARGERKYVQGADGRFQLAIAKPEKRPRALEPQSKRKKLMALAAGTSNPHEADTARRMAAKVRD